MGTGGEQSFSKLLFDMLEFSGLWTPKIKK